MAFGFAKPQCTLYRAFQVAADSDATILRCHLLIGKSSTNRDLYVTALISLMHQLDCNTWYFHRIVVAHAHQAPPNPLHAHEQVRVPPHMSS